jgi:exopolysaccharide biosynthesis polyprenyl glycosylphosphotransferase
VLVTDTEHLGAHALRELTWELDGTGVELILSPNVLDVVSSRLHLHDVSGMPMLHVASPQYPGANRFVKGAFDRIGALVALCIFAPLLLVTAATVKFSSRGPVFYRQERVGLGGRTFGMIKFRSMRVGADTQLMALLEAEGKNAAELPKLTVDPRITRVGHFIRRFSIDELPQLFNVLKGDMSLVGPRPQRDFEVELYDDVATRRLAVRPGMTGLWQVSGRSDLSFEEAIRLDVHYVANWSMTADLVIMWKTVRAVLGSDGAY